MGGNLRLYSRMSKKILFWFGVFAMSLLVMVQPAQASGIVSSGVYYKGSSSGSCPNTQTFPLMSGLIACLETAYPSYIPIAVYDANYLRAVNGTFIPYGYSGGACPANSTSGLATCTCNAGFIPNAAATACVVEVVCPAVNTFHSAGFYNIGTIPTGSMNVSPCVNGCKLFTFQSTSPPGQDLYISASPKFKQLHNGIYYYFVEASYFHTGQNCSPDTPNFLADFVGSKPDQTCQAGQQMISMYGVTKCFNSDGTEANPNSASAVAAAKTLADAKIAAQIAAAASAVAAAGGSASDVAAAQTVAAGVAAAQAGAPTDTGYALDDPMNAFCVDNPQAQICKDQTAGAKTVGTAALSGLYTDGALIGGKTVSSVIGGFKTRVLASGIGSAVGGFFTVNQAAGSCPIWSVNAPMIGVLSFDFYCGSTFQNLLPWIRSVLLLIFSVIAFRIAIL